MDGFSRKDYTAGSLYENFNPMGLLEDKDG
jgi:hypothetical protein